MAWAATPVVGQDKYSQSTRDSKRNQTDIFIGVQSFYFPLKICASKQAAPLVFVRLP